MHLPDRDALTRHHAIWAGMFLAVYLLLYFLSSPSPVDSAPQLHGSLQFLLGMRAFNVLLFALTAVLTYVLVDEMFDDERMAVLAALLVIVSPLANHAIVAWTHVPVAFLTVLAFLAYHRFLDGYETRWFVVLAGSAAFIFTIKYPDVVLMLPILVHMGVLVVRDREFEIIRKSLLPLAVLLIIVAPTAAFHYASFGSVTTTPYHMRPHALPPNDKPNIAVTFDPARLVKTVPAMLFRFDPGMEMLQQNVEDFDYAEHKSALFQSTPPLILGLFGFVLAWRRRDHRRFTALAVSSSALLVGLYGSWIYFSGGWTTNMRYLTPTVPFLAVFAAYAVSALDIEWQRFVRIGTGVGIPSFVVAAVVAMWMDPLPANEVMNTAAFLTMVAVSLAFLLAAYRGGEWIYTAFYGVFGAAVGVAGAMVLVVDNLRLFNAPEGTKLFANADKSIFLGVALAAAVTAALYLAARRISDIRDVMAEVVDRIPVR